MSGGLLTKRSLQNEVTGIDLQVPLYNEVRGTMMTGHVEYQIIVVTRLAAFKSPKHKQEDMIQLLVSKKYSEFNEFYNRLNAQYSSISLPEMPRKVLFVSEADIHKRRLAFDVLVKFISKNSTLAACPELLEFLGAKMNGNYFSDRNFAIEEDSENNEVSFFQREETSTGVPREYRSEMKPIHEQDSTEQGNVKHQKNLLPEGNSSEVKLFEEPELGGSPSPFLPPAGPSLLPPAGPSLLPPAGPSLLPSAGPSLLPSAGPSLLPSAGPSLLPPAGPSLLPSAGPSLLPPAGPSLLPPAGPSLLPSAGPSLLPPAGPSLLPSAGPSLLPSAGPSLLPSAGPSLLPPVSLLPSAGASAGCGADDDANELFRIEDDFDKLLQIKKCIKDELTSVPKTNPKPALLKKPETSISSGGQSLIVDQLKDQMDVLKYIQENESTAANDLELF